MLSLDSYHRGYSNETLATGSSDYAKKCHMLGLYHRQVGKVPLLTDEAIRGQVEYLEKQEIKREEYWSQKRG